MVFQPGQSGNPAGYHGTRRERHKKVFEEIAKLGHKDALITLSTIQHESQDESLKVAAAAALAPYAHPKLQALPTPRYIEHPFELPPFETIPEAERILGQIPILFAKGELDSQSATELTTMLQAWIQARTGSELEERLVIIEQSLNLPTNGNGHSPPAAIGGLPRLPGTSIRMPGDTDSNESSNGGDETSDTNQSEGPGPQT